MVDFMAEVQTPLFWAGLLTVIWVNIILSGDNVVVIALAVRSLPQHQRKRAVYWGAGAVVVMRIILTIVAVELLKLPYLKIVGALLLLWIAVKLLMPGDGGDEIEAPDNLIQAIKTILIADLVMSMDNVIAVAAAAKGNILVLVPGLVVSIPLVIFSATALVKLMERYPVIITLGAAILGWVAGEMLITDPILVQWIETHVGWIYFGPRVSWTAVAGAVLVVALGKWPGARRAQAREGRGSDSR
jgi:YjbE family integral membrane protein